MAYEILLVGFSASVFLIGLGLAFNATGKTGQGEGSLVSKKESSAYLRSLNYIIDKKPDKAIAELSKAVQFNSETVEIYLHLGKLFRDQGKLEKAIRVHKSIILRPSLPKELHILSLMNLGADYKKAGLLDRAVDTFKEAIKIDPNNIESYIGLEKLYEEEGNWEQAYMVQQRILKLSKANDKSPLAFLQVKIGEDYRQKGDTKQALKRFQTAMQLDDRCTPAYLYYGDVCMEMGKTDKAQETWGTMIRLGLRFSFLGYDRLRKLNNPDALEKLYTQVLKDRPHDIRTRMEMADFYRKKNQFSKAIEEIKAIVRFKPHLAEVHKYIIDLILDEDKEENVLGKYKNILMDINIASHTYTCSKCGYGPREILWHCPQCREWNTFMDDLIENEESALLLEA